MPLVKGSSRKAVSKNISTEMHAGKPHKQAVAIALDVARRSERHSPSAMDMGVGGPDALDIAEQYIRDHEANLEGC